MVIDTVYDGEDLAEVGRLDRPRNRRSDRQRIPGRSGRWRSAASRRASATWWGRTRCWKFPRRSSPRTAVPAGSVALAGNYSAVYPRKSPGGWQLIGRTAARMWDLSRGRAGTGQPGSPRPVPCRPRRCGHGARASIRRGGAGRAKRIPGLRIVSPGLQSLIQDLGRPGHAGLGVSAAGALDRASLRRANRLVGNHPSAAVVETVAGGLRVQAVGDQVLAVAGAPSALTVVTRRRALYPDAELSRAARAGAAAHGAHGHRVRPAGR